MPTLTQLEYIVAVEKYRHFGKAAEACHISQPTLSMQIQKVEDEISVTLFDRLKKPIVPTTIGKRFIHQAKVILQESQRLLQISKASENEVSGEFRLGIIPTIAPYLLPLFIEEFSNKFPKVDLIIDEMKTASIIDGLKSDSLDGGILATPIHEPSFKERTLYYEPFFLYVSKNHDLAKRKNIRETDLDGSDVWLLQDGHCFRNQIVRFCSIKGDRHIFKNVHFEGGNLETLRYLVRQSRGYTLVPYLLNAGLPAAERQTHIRPFVAPVPTREVSLVFRRDQWRTEICDAISNTVLAKIPKFLLHADPKKQAILEVEP